MRLEEVCDAAEKKNGRRPTGKQIAAILRDTGFRLADKQIVSKVANQDDYGVTFLPSAWEAINTAYGIGGCQKKKPNRAKAWQVTLRCEVDMKAKALRAMEIRGISSYQDYLYQLLLEDIEATKSPVSHFAV